MVRMLVTMVMSNDGVDGAVDVDGGGGAQAGVPDDVEVQGAGDDDRLGVQARAGPQRMSTMLSGADEAGVEAEMTICLSKGGRGSGGVRTAYIW